MTDRLFHALDAHKPSFFRFQQMNAGGGPQSANRRRRFPSEDGSQAYAEAHATLITFCAMSGNWSDDHEAPPSWVPNTWPRRVQK